MPWSLEKRSGVLLQVGEARVTAMEMAMDGGITCVGGRSYMYLTMYSSRANVLLDMAEPPRLRLQ